MRSRFWENLRHRKVDRMKSNKDWMRGRPGSRAESRPGAAAKRRAASRTKNKAARRSRRKNR